MALMVTSHQWLYFQPILFAVGNSNFEIKFLTGFTINTIMQNLTISIINIFHNPLPASATKDASGMNIRAFINEPVIVQSQQRAIINTCLFIELPSG